MDSVRSPLAYPPVAKETISSERAAYVHISMIAPKAKHGAMLFTLISQRVGHNTGDASDPLYAGTARARASSLRTGSRSCVSCNARGGSGRCRGATSRRSYMARYLRSFLPPYAAGFARSTAAIVFTPMRRCGVPVDATTGGTEMSVAARPRARARAGFNGCGTLR